MIDSTELVKLAYLKYLNREFDEEGLNYWVDYINELKLSAKKDIEIILEKKFTNSIEYLNINKSLSGKIDIVLNNQNDIKKTLDNIINNLNFDSNTINNLKYDVSNYDLLRNNTVNYSASVSSTYPDYQGITFKLNNAIKSTNLFEEFSTNSDGKNLKITFDFENLVAISSLKLRQRQMNNDSSKLKSIKIIYYASDGTKRIYPLELLNENDNELSELYNSRTGNNWGIQKQTNFTFESPVPFTKKLEIVGDEIINENDEFKNTGFIDIQILGLSLPENDLLLLLNKSLSLEPSILNSFPPSNSSYFDIYTYLPTEIKEPLPVVAADSSIVPKLIKAFLPGYHLCNITRNYLHCVFSGVAGFYEILSKSYINDIENNLYTFVDKYLEFKNNILNLSDFDKELAQIIVVMIETDAEILQTTQAANNGILNGTGTLWAFKYFLETKGRFDENKTIYESLISAVNKINLLINDPDINNDNINKIKDNILIMDSPLGNTWDWVIQQVFGVHFRNLLDLLPYTGKIDIKLEFLDSLFYKSNTLLLGDIITYTGEVNVISMNNMTLIDENRFLFNIIPEEFNHCAQALALFNYVKNIKINGKQFLNTISGENIINLISNMINYEQELVKGILPENTIYKLYPDKFWNLTHQISNFLTQMTNNLPGNDPSIIPLGNLNISDNAWIVRQLIGIYNTHIIRINSYLNDENLKIKFISLGWNFIGANTQELDLSYNTLLNSIENKEKEHSFLGSLTYYNNSIQYIDDLPNQIMIDYNDINMPVNFEGKNYNSLYEYYTSFINEVGQPPSDQVNPPLTDELIHPYCPKEPEIAILAKWPASTITDPRHLSIYEYHSLDGNTNIETGGGFVTVNEPFVASMPGFQSCFSVRTWVIRDFGGVVGFPTTFGDKVDIDYNNGETFVSKYLLWKQETTTLAEGKEKTGRTLMANIIDIFGYVLKTEETAQKELLNGAGTKWVSSIFFSETVDGIRPELTPIYIKFPEHVDNLLNLGWEAYDNRDNRTDPNPGPFGSIIFTKDIINLHMRATLTLAKNNGLTEEYANIWKTLDYDLFGNLSTITLDLPLQRYGIKVIPRDYEICSTAIRMWEYMGELLTGIQPYACTARGNTILYNVSLLFTYEKKILNGGPADKTVDDVFNLTNAAITALTFSRSSHKHANSVDLLSEFQTNKILYYLSYIFYVHIGIINNSKVIQEKGIEYVSSMLIENPKIADWNARYTVDELAEAYVYYTKATLSN